MILSSRGLPLALMAFVILSLMTPAHGAIIVKGNLDLPQLSDRSIIVDEIDNTNAALGRLETAIAPVPPMAPPGAMLSPLLPVLPQDKPAEVTVKPAADTAETHSETLDEPQPETEPYVMLLVGLGMIAVAIVLHLRPIQHRRSGFQPSQGMPFV